MSEAASIKKVSRPLTKDLLVAEIQALGVRAGAALLVHSSLSALGWVCGGSVTVIQALMTAVTAEGTLVMPAHSGDLSDPAGWQNPPVPAAWHQIIRETMPAYDPRLTPTRGVGKIPELFRTWPDVKRSAHPQVSFAAWGQHAEFVTGGHELSYSLGETSPLARLYDLDGHVLLLGVGYDSNTAFHLAEYRAPGAELMTAGAPVLVNGRSQWATFADVDIDDEPFPAVGQAFDDTGKVTQGKVGAADCRLYRIRDGVDFAQSWLTAHWSARTGS